VEKIVKGSWKKYRDCIIAAFHAMRDRSISKTRISAGMLMVHIDTNLFPGMASEDPVPELVAEVLDEELVDKELSYEIDGSGTGMKSRLFTLNAVLPVVERIELMFTVIRTATEEDAFPIMNQLTDTALSKLVS
jgi:hypothetical protein